MVTYMLPVRVMIIIKYYTTASGVSPFVKWFNGLDATQREKVTTAITRLQTGRSVNRKALKRRLIEIKISSGGLRAYFAEDGKEIILLLGGGKKGSQKRDIENSRKRLAEYLSRKEQTDDTTTDR